MAEDTETTEGAGDVLNANRNRYKTDDATNAGGSASMSATPLAGRPTPAAFNWRAWWPWLLAAIVLLLIVWMMTRRSSGGGGAA